MWEMLYWVLALLACMTGLAILLLSLLHVRYRAAWQGEWTGDFSFPHDGNVSIEFGFPGFMRAWTWKPPLPAPEGGENATAGVDPERRATGDGRLPVNAHNAPSAPPSAQNRIAPEDTPFARRPTPDEQGTVREETPDERRAAREEPTDKNGKPRKDTRDPHRARKSLFHLFTDRTAWALVIRYGFRVMKLVHRLFRPRVNLAVGHPDPALLGRLAGKWYAVAPLLPLGDTAMNFRFQDRRPTLRVNVQGGFSALSLLFFGIAAFGVFPFFGLGRRAWRGWRQPHLTGWRAWAYRCIQSL